jgi:hypothetical protein
VRFLTPFDPVVHDRGRFERLWGWSYRFEAYTPVAERQRGYYALPLLWRDRVIGWANVSVKDAKLEVELGYVSSHAPRERAYKHALEAEMHRMRSGGHSAGCLDPRCSSTERGAHWGNWGNPSSSGSHGALSDTHVWARGRPVNGVSRLPSRTRRTSRLAAR